MINPFPEYKSINNKDLTTTNPNAILVKIKGEEEKGKNVGQLGGQVDLLSTANNTFFVKLLKFLLENGEGSLTSCLEPLFKAKEDGSISIKPSNIHTMSEGFQLGGGVGAFPDFQKAPTPKYTPLPSLGTKKRDLQDSLSMILEDQGDLVKYLTYVSSKYLDKHGSPLKSEEIVDLDKVYFDDILIKDRNVSKFMNLNSIKESNSTEKSKTQQFLQALQNGGLRSTLNNLLKDLKYDTSRITKAVTSSHLDKFSGFTIDMKTTPKDKNEQSSSNEQENGTKVVSETVASEIQQPTAQDETKTATAPKQEKASIISLLPQVTMPSFLQTSGGGSKLPNMSSNNKQALEIIQELDAFATRIKRKQEKWLDELKVMNSQGQVSLNSQIQNKVKMLSSDGILEIERKKISIQLLSLFKKFLSACDNKATVSYAYFKDFFVTDKRREIRTLLNYIEAFAFINSQSFIASITEKQDVQNLAELQKVYKNVVDSYNIIVSQLHANNKNFFSSLSSLIEDVIKDNYMISMRDKERGQIMSKMRGVIDTIEGYPDKIKYFYTLSYPVTDMFDAQFIILYIIKALRIISFQFSMNMATNIFLQKYESVVYDQKQVPPTLISYMFMFLAFDLFFNTFMLVSLGLCGFLFKTDNNAFPIDKYFFTKFGFDYVISTTVILLIGMLVGRIVRDKKYFRYKTEGERGIRAFEEIMKSIASIITALPLFLVVS